ncbi:hypothetical protein ACFPRL_31595 [Pseudoclavibacter helvolus]
MLAQRRDLPGHASFTAPDAWRSILGGCPPIVTRRLSFALNALAKPTVS